MLPAPGPTTGAGCHQQVHPSAKRLSATCAVSVYWLSLESFAHVVHGRPVKTFHFDSPSQFKWMIDALKTLKGDALIGADGQPLMVRRHAESITSRQLVGMSQCEAVHGANSPSIQDRCRSSTAAAHGKGNSRFQMGSARTGKVATVARVVIRTEKRSLTYIQNPYGWINSRFSTLTEELTGGSFGRGALMVEQSD